MPHSAKCIIDMIETRTIKKKKEQLRLKLYRNVGTTSLGQNLLVLIKKSVHLFTISLSFIVSSLVVQYRSGNETLLIHYITELYGTKSSCAMSVKKRTFYYSLISLSCIVPSLVVQYRSRDVTLLIHYLPGLYCTKSTCSCVISKLYLFIVSLDL